MEFGGPQWRSSVIPGITVVVVASLLALNFVLGLFFIGMAIRFAILPGLRGASLRNRSRALKQGRKPRPAWIAWLIP